MCGSCQFLRGILLGFSIMQYEIVHGISKYIFQTLYVHTKLCDVITIVLGNILTMILTNFIHALIYIIGHGVE